MSCNTNIKRCTFFPLCTRLCRLSICFSCVRFIDCNSTSDLCDGAARASGLDWDCEAVVAGAITGAVATSGVELISVLSVVAKRNNGKLRDCSTCCRFLPGVVFVDGDVKRTFSPVFLCLKVRTNIFVASVEMRWSAGGSVECVAIYFSTSFYMCEYKKIPLDIRQISGVVLWNFHVRVNLVTMRTCLGESGLSYSIEKSSCHDGAAVVVVRWHP